MQKTGKNKTISMRSPNIYPAGRRLASPNVRMHAHDFTELILVTQGQCMIKTQNDESNICEEKSLMLAAGDLIVIPPHISHNQIQNDYVGTSYVGFSQLQYQFDCSLRIIPLKDELYITRWIDDIIDLYSVTHDNSRYCEVAEGLMKAIITRIKQIENSQKNTMTIHPIVQEAVKIIHSNLTETITVDQISAKIDISSSYLTKLFKKDIGCGLIQYQQQQRMRLACRYLHNPYLRVKQVANKCGYDNVNFFIRVFRKHYRTSPNKWRRD